MRKDLIMNKQIYSSFFSCPDDVKVLLEKLFVESRPYSDRLKKLLVINNPDCLVDKEQYQKIIDSFSVARLIKEGYIRLNPKIQRGTHEEIKSYIIISFDNFSSNRISPRYMDYTIHFDIVCYNDAWVLNNLAIRPLMICGYIDGILNSLSDDNKKFQKDHQSKIKLSGIGEYNFIGANEVVLNEDLSMYSLTYRGVHLSQDFESLGMINSIG